MGFLGSRKAYVKSYADCYAHQNRNGDEPSFWINKLRRRRKRIRIQARPIYES